MPAAAASPPHSSMAGAPLLRLTYGTLAQRIQGAFRVLARALIFLAIVGLVIITEKRSEWVPVFMMLVVPAIFIVRAWAKGETRGFPLLPILAVQQLLVYTTPLLVATPATRAVSTGVMDRCGLSMLLFFSALYVGWLLVFDPRRPGRGSKWNFGMIEGADAVGRIGRMAMGLLVVTIGFQLLNLTGLIWNLLPPALYGVFPVLRTIAGAASMLGGFMGALAVGRGLGQGGAVIFWLLVLMTGTFAIAGVLLSAASGLVVAVTLGLLFGGGRVPWRFVLVAFVILGFFNQGKFVMRAKYWGDDGTTRSSSLSDLPAFFAEWADASAAYLFDPQRKGVGNVQVERGQPLIERINNLQNLTYVIEALARGNKDTLQGETYTMIPALLVPRIFWPDKPRSHQGQVMLNLHYGRQLDIEATEETYIAWGLVPESVGNFGSLGGPLLLGLALGMLIGRVETWTLRVRLFSVEGLVTAVAMMIISMSYEMVASVLVTAVFQAVVASLGGGLFLYFWLGRTQDLDGGRPPPYPNGRGSKVDRYGA